MANIKVTGLTAVTPPINKGSLVLASTFDGVTTYTSEKVTVSQLADSVFLMDAEQKITFDSSGTNKVFADDSVGTQAILMDASNYLALSADGTTTLTKGYTEVSNTEARIGFDDSNASGTLTMTSSGFDMEANAAVLITGNATGLGFFNATAVAKPTAVAVSAAGIHAALVSLGLIS
jgi:hypothetical protein